MPTYDYQCRSCGSVTEVIHSMLEQGPSACERCGGELRRVLYPAGIIFKGSGFYRTDSRSAASSDGATASGATASGASETSKGADTSKSSESKASSSPASDAPKAADSSSA